MSQQEGLQPFIKDLSLKQKIPVVALTKLLEERQKIDNLQEQSIVKIKISYQQRLRPLLQRASQIIRGNPLKQQQVSEANLYLKPSQNIKNYLKGKVIDNYWNSVLSNSPLVDEVTQNDEKALSYLLDIQNVYPETTTENQSTSLKFIFKQNPYFNQTQIVRHLRVKNGQIIALQGDQITWKQGKWLTYEKKKITNKKTGESKIDKGKKIKSFFDIFLDWNVQNQNQLVRAGNFMIELANMIVLDSLDYFLGLINVEDQSDIDEQEQDDQEEEQAEAGKKIKQN